MLKYVPLLALVLAGCADPAPSCSDASDPAQCEAVVSAGGNASDYLLYGMAGYMLASTINGQQVVRRDPTYVGPSRYNPARVQRPRPLSEFRKAQAVKVENAKRQNAMQAQRAASRPSTSRPSYSAPRMSTRSFGGRR